MLTDITFYLLKNQNALPDAQMICGLDISKRPIIASVNSLSKSSTVIPLQRARDGFEHFKQSHQFKGPNLVA